MTRKNMFNKYILSDPVEHEGETQEIPRLPIPSSFEEKKPSYNFPLPLSILPWKNNEEKLLSYTSRLVDAGYDTIELIISASVEEVYNLTDIPRGEVKELIYRANTLSDYSFETAASLFRIQKDRIRISTSNPNLDKILGGGVETGSITEFYGESITGKTQIGLQLAVNTALPSADGGLGGKVVYIDTEGSFNAERVRQMCTRWDIDPSKILTNIMVGRAYTTDMQIAMVENIIRINRDKEIKLMVIDSLTSNFRAEFIGKEALIDRQQKLNHHIQQLSRMANIFDLAVVITNQVMSSFDHDGIKPVGGNILAHGTTHRVQLTKFLSRSGRRMAKLVASSALPDKACEFQISAIGIE